MVIVHRLNGQEFLINADHIETLESTPDTVVSLVNGRKYIVKDAIPDVVRQVVKYKQACNQGFQVIDRTKLGEGDKQAKGPAPGAARSGG